jgi:hypothetical protein
VGTNSSAKPGLAASLRSIKRPASLALPNLASSQCDKSWDRGSSWPVENVGLTNFLGVLTAVVFLSRFTLYWLLPLRKYREAVEHRSPG